jgi:hypothetical protein
MNAHQVTNEDRSRIALVADALRRKAPQPELTASLVQSGLSASEASDFCSTVSHGLRAGVAAGVTGGALAEQYSDSEPAILQAAFVSSVRYFSLARIPLLRSTTQLPRHAPPSLSLGLFA